MLYNLNVPNLSRSEIRGIRMTSLSSTLSLTRNVISVSGDHSLKNSPSADEADGGNERGTDAWALARGYVSITPLRVFPDLVYMAPWAEAARTVPALASDHEFAE
jgi:broad specificity polyphosphatase/5'/3'-nucleotidase SurE